MILDSLSTACELIGATFAAFACIVIVVFRKRIPAAIGFAPLAILLSVSTLNYLVNSIEWVGVKTSIDLDTIEDSLDLMAPLAWWFFFYAILQATARGDVQISEERFNTLLEAVDDVVWSADLSGSFHFINSASERIYGRTREELQNNPNYWLDAVHPADRNRVKTATDHLLELRSHAIEYRIVRPDGSECWVSDRKSVVKGPDGTSRIGGLTTDITNRKLAESERERLLGILRRSINEIYVFDAETYCFEYVNESALKNLAYSLEDMQSKTPLDIKPHYTIESFNELVTPLRSGQQESVRFETVHQRRDGTHYPVEVHLQLIERNGELVFLAVILDCTERKREQQQFQTIVETTQEWIWEIDLNGVHTYSNPAIEQILGYRVDEIVGGQSLDLILAGDRMEVAARLPRLIAAEVGWTGWVLRWQHKDGTIRYLESNATPIRDVDGHLAGYRGADRDITDRVESQRLLSLSEERYRVMTENATEAIVVLDMDTGRFYDSNRRANNFFKASPEQLRSLGPAELSPEFQPGGERSTDLARLHIQAAVEGEERVFEWMHQDTQGNQLPTEVRLVRLPHHSRNLVRGAVTDITERRKAQQALQASEERYRRLVQSSPMCIHELDRDGSLLSMNATGLHMLELSDESEVRGMRYLDAVAECDRDRIAALLEDAVAGQECHFSFQTPGSRYFESCFVPIRNSEGRVERIMGITQDATDRKHAEESLRRSREELRSLNISLERRVAERTAELQVANDDLEAYAQSVAHDLRAPLRAMYGFARALREDYADKLDEHGREYTEFIDNAAYQMDLLIQDILEYSKVGRSEMSIDDLDLDQIADLAREQLAAEIEQSQANITIEQPLGHVVGHRSSLVQVIVNLISNGMKFVADGSLPEVRVWTELRDEKTVLWVKDNGIGISEKDQKKIFRVFERLHGVESYPGTGIGLAIVRRAVESMNGRFGVESEVGAGSRFWVELPRSTDG